jgi:hypothetical protein
MARRARHEEQEFGSESFLDVIANVVGILIILVMITGMRIQRSLAESVTVEVPAIDLTAPQAELNGLEEELSRLTSQAGAAGSAAAARQAEQEELAAALRQRQREIEERRRALDAQAQQMFDSQRQRASAEALAAQLRRDLASAEGSRSQVTVESYPTPLARSVDGKEEHFQLRAGRIAHIPLEELLTKLKADAPSQFWKLKDLPEATGTVGPIDGFRLRYTFQRVDVPLEDQMAGKRLVGSFAQLSQWTLVPSDILMGETIEEALAPRSNVRTVLAKHRSRDTTITLWTYPDSFSEFRQLKKELYLMGFPIAGRPLPADAPIGGSPRGSKSAAQ